MQDGSTSAVCSQCASPLSESVALSAGVYQFTASSSEGLLGLAVRWSSGLASLGRVTEGVVSAGWKVLDCLHLVICSANKYLIQGHAFVEQWWQACITLWRSETLMHSCEPVCNWHDAVGSELQNRIQVTMYTVQAPIWLLLQELLQLQATLRTVIVHSTETQISHHLTSDLCSWHKLKLVKQWRLSPMYWYLWYHIKIQCRLDL